MEKKYRKLSDYYTAEETETVKQGKAMAMWIDEPFFRAFDDYVTELGVSRKEFRHLYWWGKNSGAHFTETGTGASIMGLELVVI